MKIMGIIIFIAGIAFIVFLLNLSDRVQKLERYMQSGSPLNVPAQTTPSQSMPEQSYPQMQQQLYREATPQATSEKVRGSTVSEKFVIWLKEDWLLKLGALLLLVGFGLLTT